MNSLIGRSWELAVKSKTDGKAQGATGGISEALTLSALPTRPRVCDTTDSRPACLPVHSAQPTAWELRAAQAWWASNRPAELARARLAAQLTSRATSPGHLVQGPRGRTQPPPLGWPVVSSRMTPGDCGFSSTY